MGKNYHKDAIEAQISALEAWIARDTALLNQLRQVRDEAAKRLSGRKTRKAKAVPAPVANPAENPVS